MNAHYQQMNARRNKGLTLVELMISMVLGLIVVGGVVSVLVANKQTYRTNEGVSQVQESARTAFELIARDVRQAAGTGCDNNNRIANVLDPTGTPPWWSVWFGIRGYDGAQTDPATGFGTWAAGSANNRINGTDSLVLQGLEGTGLSVEDHNQTSANLKINATTTQIVENDILVVCDFDHAAIFRVSEYNAANVTVVHNTGSSPVPENCFKGLGYPVPAPPCGGNGNTYKFGRNSQIAKFAASDWYIGDNNRPTEGGRSLFRKRLAGGGALVQEEIAAGVTDMQIAYRLSNTTDFVDANHASLTAATWANVNAMRITLTVQSIDQRLSTDASVNSGRLQRDFTSVITFRNRVP